MTMPTVLEAVPPAPASVPPMGASELRILDPLAGDTRLIWNKDDADEVANAKRTFDELVGKKGRLAYKVKDKGEQGEQISEFDPDAEKIIIAPRMKGG